MKTCFDVVYNYDVAYDVVFDVVKVVTLLGWKETANNKLVCDK